MRRLRGVILAFGRGSAQHPFGLRTLQLMPVGNRPLVHHAVTELSSAGIHEIVVVSDPRATSRMQAALAERLPASVTLHHVNAPAGFSEVAALADACRIMGASTFVAHRGDALLGEALSAELERFHEGDAHAVELMFGVDGDGQRSPAADTSRTASARTHPLGVEILSEEIVQQLGAVEEQRSASRRLSSRGDWSVEARVVDRAWRLEPEGGNLLEGNRFALHDLACGWHADSVVRSDLKGAVVIHPSARVEDSVLRGPCVIGAEALVRHAYIGPNTSIGDRCAIENVEVDDSVVMDGATITNVGWRLEQSVIGPQARLTRRFRLPQTVRLLVGEHARISVS